MFKKIASLAALSTVATGVLAAGTGPDLTPLTSVVDFGTVITAVLAIAGLLAGVERTRVRAAEITAYAARHRDAGEIGRAHV